MKKGDDMEFDFKKRGRTLRMVPRDERNAAMSKLISYVASRLKGKTQSGAYANSWFGSKTAVEYFTDVAYGVVFDRRKLDNPKSWKDDKLLTDLLKAAAWSAMGHWYREWKKIYKKSVPAMLESELPEAEELANILVLNEESIDEKTRQKVDEEADEERRIGYEEVEELVKDNPIFKKYVKGVKDLNDMRGISKRMKMTIAQCEEIEAELLEVIDNYLKSKKKIPKSRVVSLV